MIKSFNHYSQYYDLLYQDKNYQQEVKYLESTINSYGNFKSILDLGCGTGLHASLLNERGYTVHGVDQSETMLETAYKRKSSTLSFSLGDMRNISLGKKFDVVTALFHVMSYQISNQDLNNSLKTIKEHLAPNGIFIFDCWYGPAVLKHRPECRIKRLSDENFQLTRIAEPTLYLNENRVDVHYEIIIENREQTIRERIKETHSMRYLFYPEIEFMASTHGLQLLKTEEWITKKDPCDDTWGVVFIGKHQIGTKV